MGKRGNDIKFVENEPDFIKKLRGNYQQPSIESKKFTSEHTLEDLQDFDEDAPQIELSKGLTGEFAYEKGQIVEKAVVKTNEKPTRTSKIATGSRPTKKVKKSESMSKKQIKNLKNKSLLSFDDN